MSGKKVVVTITKEGEIKIEAEGYEGSGCLKATEPFEKAFGAVKGRTLKDEYYHSHTERDEEYASF